MSMKKGAENAVNTCMGVRKRDHVLIVTDPEKEAIARAIFDVTRKVTERVAMVVIPPFKGPKKEPPEMVAKAMQSSTVIFITTEHSITHTRARLRACERGARVASMPGITEAIFSRGGMQADYGIISERAKKLQRSLKKSSEVKITSSTGTALELYVKGRPWIADTGICHTPGSFTNLPAGSIFVAPLEHKAEGEIHFDGGIESNEYGDRIEIKNGIMENLPNIRDLKSVFDKSGKCIHYLSRLGIGLNYRSRYCGVMIEDTKVEGNVHIGFGENASIGGKIRCRVFIEGIIRKPTVIIDDKLIIKNGRFVMEL